MSEKLPDCMIGPSEPCAGYAALLAHIAEKDARIAELEPNAKRYLWLRERNVFRSDPPVCHVKWEVYRDGVWSHTERPSGAELDTAIDAAMGDK